MIPEEACNSGVVCIICLLSFWLVAIFAGDVIYGVGLTVHDADGEVVKILAVASVVWYVLLWGGVGWGGVEWDGVGCCYVRHTAVSFAQVVYMDAKATNGKRTSCCILP